VTQARIYQPCKTAMQSGRAGTRKWVLEFDSAEAKSPDPIMGWSGSGDMNSQIRMKFASLEDAEAYAKKKALDYRVQMPQQRKPHIKAYADNFS
jgi:NADH dehydrogenase ubiquinone Fe-S protein 4